MQENFFWLHLLQVGGSLEKVGDKVHSRKTATCGKIVCSPLEDITLLGSGVGSSLCFQDPGATGLEGSQKGRRNRWSTVL